MATPLKQQIPTWLQLIPYYNDSNTSLTWLILFFAPDILNIPSVIIAGQWER